MTPRDQAEALIKAGHSKVRVKYTNGTSDTIRIFRGRSGELCNFRRRSRRYGYMLNFDQIAEIQAISSRKTKAEKWRDGWLKVKARLEKSGLWENIVKDIDLALEVGYDTLQVAYHDYWEMDVGGRSEEFAKKYPKLCYKNAEGKDCVNTTVLWHIENPPKVKKMQFERKYLNEGILAGIQKAMDEKREHHASGRERYDVSFEYRPSTNRAWYSEEFRGCGNGHYYLALDATHAIFWEDD